MDQNGWQGWGIFAGGILSGLSGWKAWRAFRPAAPDPDFKSFYEIELPELRRRIAAIERQHYLAGEEQYRQHRENQDKLAIQDGKLEDILDRLRRLRPQGAD
jgi:hypothetical protein